MTRTPLKAFLLASLVVAGCLAEVSVASTLSTLTDPSQPLPVLVSDGSSGEFHPTADVELDLRDSSSLPQFSNVYIDSGIHVRVLTPDLGYGYLLAAGIIQLNGSLDAGSGALYLSANNGIVINDGALISAGSLALASGRSVTLASGADLQLTAPLGSGAKLVDLPGGSISLQAPVPLPAAGLLLGSGLLGLIAFGAARRPG